MNVRWKKLLVTTTLWLVTEIGFNFLGIDNLVDYSEFIFERPEIVQPLLTFFPLSKSYLNPPLHALKIFN